MLDMVPGGAASYILSGTLIRSMIHLYGYKVVEPFAPPSPLDLIPSLLSPSSGIIYTPLQLRHTRHGHQHHLLELTSTTP